MFSLFPRFIELRSNVPVSDIERRSFQLDAYRFIFQGFIDVSLKTYALLVSIRVFHLPASMKGVLVASNYIGMVLSPLFVQLFAKYVNLPNTYIVALMMYCVGMCIICSSLFSNGIAFICFICFAKILYKETLPFVTDVYNRNYHRERRGRIIGTLFMVLAVSEVIFSLIGGRVLDMSLSYYRILFIFSAFAAFEGGFMFSLLPNAQRLTYRPGKIISSNIKLLREDKLFTHVLICWSLTSVAFQMTFPLRVEYLANKIYGINLSNTYITMLIIVIPTCTRILSAIFWGKVFDFYNFAVMKMMINVCFLIGIPVFFFSKDIHLLIISSIAIGIAHSGNLTAWQLWVTKLVPSPDRLSEYVGVDVAVMGIRDAFASMFGYFLLSRGVSLHAISVLSMLLIFFSSFGFYHLSKNSRLN